MIGLKRRNGTVKMAGVQMSRDGGQSEDGHNCASAVFVTQEVMAAFDAENGEAGLSEGGNDFGPGDARCPAHAAMVTR